MVVNNIGDSKAAESRAYGESSLYSYLSHSNNQLFSLPGLFREVGAQVRYARGWPADSFLPDLLQIAAISGLSFSTISWSPSCALKSPAIAGLFDRCHIVPQIIAISWSVDLGHDWDPTDDIALHTYVIC